MPYSKKTQSIIYDLTEMESIFGNYPLTELEYETPFQCLIAVMLSAQTTDKQVNIVTRKFFPYIRTPDDVFKYTPEHIYTLIQGVNYSKTKAKHLYATASMLVDLPAPYIPDSLEELIKLPGVGIKTAKVVAYIVHRQPYIAVDTHVQRVSHRLGRVTTTIPEKTSALLEKLIPDSYKSIAHHVMIYFGRYLCKAAKPECERCPLQEKCKFFRKGLRTK